MSIVQRTCANASDKDRMAALARQFPADNFHIGDLPYRLSSWAFDDPDNIALWFDDDQRLVGWAVLQTPFWTVDMVCHPDFAPGLHGEILAWADRRARAVIHTAHGHPSWYVMVFPGQVERIHDLEQAGFQCQADVGEDSWSEVLMCRADQRPVKSYQPPAGFTVRPLAGEKEVQAYVDLHQSVFESKNMTCNWRTRTLQHPDYHPDLDIVVQSPEGRLAAFCIGWFDEHSLEGCIEPLGCHQDYRRYALGRVALAEVLRRLQTHGARAIFVHTSNYHSTAFRLYESFDFQVIQDVLVYRRDYEDN